MAVLQGGAPGHDSVQLVQITPITMVYDTYNYSYWGESKPIYNWGAPHFKSFPREWTNPGFGVEHGPAG